MNEWVAVEVEHAQLKDRRLKSRLERVLMRLSSDPERSIPSACNEWNDVIGTYRFFGNDRIEYQDVLSGHKAATLTRLKDHEVVLVAQDTTHLSLERVYNKEDFGTLKEIEREEHLLHVNVAFSSKRVNLGVLSAQLWQREGKQVAKTRKQRPTRQKESQRWLDGYQTACEVQTQHPDQWVISLSDREGDIRECYELAQEQENNAAASFIVRAAQNRRVDIEDDEQGHLWEFMSCQPILGHYEITVAAKNGNSKRIAHIDVRAGEVTLSGGAHAAAKPITVHAVWAYERDAPEGATPVRWMLITDIPVSGYEEARAIIEWYRCRWEIEIFFRVIKNACHIESMRLQTASRLYNAIAVYLIIGWRLHGLTMLAREQPDEPCDAVFSQQEWQTIYLMRKKQLPPQNPPSLKEMTRMLASLGGFLGRKGDGEPGTKTIWIGYTRLLDYIEAINLTAKLRCV